ncbi:MAG: SDR family NAD(P)-dependent oxidoreductase, partial [Pseudomonadales bacterium]|nr:SDR family NAD(P)-dependent oxidoreductase [Pseudomonadales bacterium]
MQISLAHQVALVTGASSGLGAASARALAAAGASVVLNYNSQAAPAQALADEINAAGGKAIALGADVIEADVQLTRDNIPIIMHDRLLDRTTNTSGYAYD